MQLKHFNCSLFLQISLVTDRLGSIMAYDILSKCTTSAEETLSLGENTLLDVDTVCEILIGLLDGLFIN